jgi:hypothetical protein
MFYAKINNGNVVRYPYTLTDLRLETPNISFPQTMTDAELLAFNVVPVTPTQQPNVDYTKNLSRWATKNGLSWIEVWTVTDATPEEIADRLSEQWQFVREQRDSRLQSCDWTQLPDVPLTQEQKAEWVSYRQALRDVTNQPNPFNIVWPVAP